MIAMGKSTLKWPDQFIKRVLDHYSMEEILKALGPRRALDLYIHAVGQAVAMKRIVDAMTPQQKARARKLLGMEPAARVGRANDPSKKKVASRKRPRHNQSTDGKA